MTQSAVSHQLRNLAEQIGEPLFTKEGRRIVLTAAGRRLGATLQSAFADIHRSLADTIGSNRKTMRLAVCSSFASGWLLKRLTGFYEANPGVDLQVHMYAQDPDLTDQVADAFVSTLPPPAGFWSMLLQTEFLIPVVSTSCDPFVPGKIPLITTELAPERNGAEWRTYCAEAGLGYDDLHRGHLFQVSHYILALELARLGAGVALVPDFIAKKDIKAGILYQPWPARLATGEHYQLCVKSARRGEPTLKALADWLRAQVDPGNATPETVS